MKVETKSVLAPPWLAGSILTAVIYLLVCAGLYKGDPYRNLRKYYETIFLSAGGVYKDTSSSDALKEAVWIGKILRFQHEQGVNFEELTKRVQDPDVTSYLLEKNYELIRIAKKSISLNKITKLYPAELDTVNALLALARSNDWKRFMESAENRETLRGILQGKLQPPDLSAEYNSGFFLLGFWSLIIIQSVGVFFWILDFLTNEKGNQKYRDRYGHWYNLNWRNPFVWIMMLPSCLPLLLISLAGNIKTGSVKKDGGRINLEVSSGNDDSSEDSKTLLEKLQTSISGGTHVKRNG